MTDYVKHTDGKYTLFLIPVKEADGKTIYLDFTRVAKPALKKDQYEQFDHETGPDFGTVVYRASEYVGYLKECDLTIRNFQRFGTRTGYSLFIEDA
jgi:hypothetical protein